MEKSKSQSSNVFEIKNLDFSYGNKSILKNFSLSIKEGTVHGILGGNGAGKTTFFNLLFGTLPSSHAGITDINRYDIAYLETDMFIYSYMTGAEYLELINEKNTKNVKEWNIIFELPLNDYAHNYSTGMKKKLLLLGVLLLNKKIVILDEPFNGLDLKTCEVIHYIIQRLKAVGKTILLSSHILETVIQNADEISYLEEGRILKTFDKSSFSELKQLVKSKFINDVVPRIDDLIQ